MPTEAECLSALLTLIALAETELTFECDSRHWPERSEEVERAIEVARIIARNADINE